MQEKDQAGNIRFFRHSGDVSIGVVVVVDVDGVVPFQLRAMFWYLRQFCSRIG